VGFTVGGDEAFAEQDLHAFLGAVFAEGGGFVDEDFADVVGFVEEDYMVEEDFVMGGAAVAAQVFKELDGVAGLEEFVEEVEGQVYAQARRVDVAAVAHEDGLGFGGDQVTGFEEFVGGALGHMLEAIPLTERCREAVF
jgi:hypothetical protein